MSWMRYMTLYSFRILNPDWEVVLFLSRNNVHSKTWKDSPTQDFYNYKGEDYLGMVEDLGITILRWELLNEFVDMDASKVGPSHKSNFFKWQKMAICSGFYCDLDVLFVRPFDSLYLECSHSDVLIAHHNYWSIGLLGSSGENRFFEDLYKHTFEIYTEEAYQSAGVHSVDSWCDILKKDEEIDKRENLNVVKNHYCDLQFYNLEMSRIYPWRYNQMEHVFAQQHTRVPQDCIGIHWYAGDLTSQRYNNIMEESNLKKFTNTYSYFAQKLLKKGRI